MKFDTITIHKTNAGDEVFFDYTYQPNMKANDAILMGRHLGWKEDFIYIDRATCTYIFNRK